MEEENIFEFDSPKDSSSYIKVIGVGGGGSNAVNHMFSQGIKGVDFIVCNTDEKALNASPVSNKIALDRLGAGNNPAVARAAAERNAEVIKETLSHNTQMLFITAGMGGGTGTGASPVIAQIAKSIDLDDDVTGKILVVAIVTMPFSFEGRRKKEQAEAGIAELRKHVDSILVINNDKLRAFGDKGITGAFALANDVLLTAAKGIAEIITSNALVTIDFRDVNTVMHDSGTALMGTGTGTGENRAMDAIKSATTSVLLNDNDISGAKDALLYISYNPAHEVSMDELSSVTDYVEDQINNRDCSVIWGYGADENLADDEMKITLIATGFEQKRTELPPSSDPAFKKPVEEPKRPFVLEEEPAAKPLDTTPEHVDDNEMHIVKAAKPVEETLQAAAAVAAAETMAASAAEAIAAAPAAPQAEAPKVETFHPEATYHVEVENGKTKNVYNLYSEEDTAEVALEEAEFDHEEDNDDLLNIQMVSTAEPEAEVPAPQDFQKPAEVEAPVAAAPAPAPVFQPEPQRVVVEQPAPMQQNRMAQDDTLSRADRIKRMHDLLTKNTNGPQMVEDMVLETGNPFANAFTSNMREAQKSAINADGTITDLNSYLYDNPD